MMSCLKTIYKKCHPVQTTAAKFQRRKWRCLAGLQRWDAGKETVCLKRKVPVVFVRLLRTWYSQLICSVKWNSKLGESFTISCGVRQGSVLSPYLFAVYIDDLIMDGQVLVHTLSRCSLGVFCMLMTLPYCQHHVLVRKRWLTSVLCMVRRGIYTDRLCSIVRWRHNNDAIIEKSCMYVQN